MLLAQGFGIYIYPNFVLVFFIYKQVLCITVFLILIYLKLPQANTLEEFNQMERKERKQKLKEIPFYNVRVQNTVPVNGSVEIDGSVEIEGSVEVEGIVEIDGGVDCY